MRVLPIVVAREAGPDVRAARDGGLDAAGADIVQGAALADLLNGDPILVLRGEPASQAQAHSVGIPVACEQLVPACRRTGDGVSIDGEGQLLAGVIEVAGEQAAPEQDVVAVVATLHGLGALGEGDQVQKPEHVRASGLGFGESGHGSPSKKKPALGGHECVF